MDYAFVVKSGKTPETSPPLVVQTSTIVLQPVPFASAKALPPNDDESQDTSSPSLKKTHRRKHGKSSWNATTFSKIESGATLAEDPDAESHQKVNGFLGKAVSEPFHSSLSHHHVHARSAGDEIVAEIDGVLVSWTNEYQGTAGLPSSTTVATTRESYQPIYSTQSLKVNSSSYNHSRRLPLEYSRECTVDNE